MEVEPRLTPPERRRPQETGAAEPEAAPPAQGLMLDAQARLGNHGATALARRMGRSGTGGHGGLRDGALAQPDSLTPVLARKVLDPSHTANASFADADAFKAHGVFGPTDVIEGTAGRGGFEAAYDPAADALSVVMRVGVNFKDAIDASGTPADSRHTNLAANLPPPGPARTAYIAKYHWDDAEKEPWMKSLKSSVEGVWGGVGTGKFEFFVNQPDWEWVGAKVNIDIQVHEQVSSGTEHLSVETLKFPPGENIQSAGDASETDKGDPDDARDQKMLLASTDVLPRPDQSLFWTVQFPFNSDKVSEASVDLNGNPSSMAVFITTFNGSPTGTKGSRPAKVELVGHASQSGDDAYNRDLGQRRADNVRKALNAGGFREIATRIAPPTSKGEEGANPIEDAKDRRVDMIVDGGDAQIIAAHEFGHAFGLGDQYATDAGGLITGTGKNAGSRSPHDDQTKAMTDASGKHLEGSVNENNADIMSLGNKIGPQHYSMFHAALCEITGITEWALGPKKARTSGGSTPAPSPLGPPPPAGP